MVHRVRGEPVALPAEPPGWRHPGGGDPGANRRQGGAGAPVATRRRQGIAPGHTLLHQGMATHHPSPELLQVLQEQLQFHRIAVVKRRVLGEYRITITLVNGQEFREQCLRPVR